MVSRNKALIHERAEHIRHWLTNKGNSLGRDAEHVAERLDALLRENKTSARALAARMSRVTENAGVQSVYRLTLPERLEGEERDKRAMKLTRKGASYYEAACRAAALLAQPEDEILIRLFKNTCADGVSARAFDASESFLRARFWRVISQRVKALAEVLDLNGYFRELAMNGLMRDLQETGIVFKQGDLVAQQSLDEAALPVVDALKHANVVNYPFQGLVPSIVLYRIRVADPVDAVLHLVPDDNGRGAIKVRCCVDWYQDVRLCIAPERPTGGAALCFERAWRRTLSVLGDDHNDGPHHEHTIAFADPYTPLDFRSQRECFLMNGYRQYGELRSADNKYWLAETLPWEADRVPDELPDECRDNESVIFSELNDAQLEHLFLQLPAICSHRLECVAFHPGDDSTAHSLFPAGTLAAAFERDIYDCREGAGIFGELERSIKAHVEGLRRWKADRDAHIEQRQEHALESMASLPTPRAQAEALLGALAIPVREWRRALGLTQAQAARILGVSKRAFTYYEHDELSVPRPVRLAMVLYHWWPDAARELVKTETEELG
jgi:hypothetical protein